MSSEPRSPVRCETFRSCCHDNDHRLMPQVKNLGKRQGGLAARGGAEGACALQSPNIKAMRGQPEAQRHPRRASRDFRARWSESGTTVSVVDEIITRLPVRKVGRRILFEFNGSGFLVRPVEILMKLQPKLRTSPGLTVFERGCTRRLVKTRLRHMLSVQFIACPRIACSSRTEQVA